MHNEKAARFALSQHDFRTHFDGGESFGTQMLSGFTPQTLRKAYSFDESFTGKGVRIAVIAALDNVAIEENMRIFCDSFNLPIPKMQIFYPDGRAETTSSEWLTESSLDTQWVHVFAPDAEILVVFSKNAEVESLLSAAKYASEELSCDVVSMSFGTEESGIDAGLSLFMERANCIFCASSGDVGGVTSFPSTSPFCVSVGGTNLSVASDGNAIAETAWKNSGGGKSDIFDIPPYQGRFFNIYGMTDGKRGTPDVSMSANFSPGVPVYVSQLGGWTNVGGTSLACACFAGVCACIKERYPDIKTGTDVLSFLYDKAGGDGYEFPQYNFNDITVGKSGNNYAEKGFDFATGLGSPVIRRILL